MKTLLTATCLLLACPAVWAGAPVVDAGSTGTSAVFTPKTKSVFTATADQHNPFWPIGWVKTEDESADTSAPVIPHTEDFQVTTILLNDPPMAVINGKDMAEGEVATIPTLSGANVVVQLMAVQDGRIILRWENQNIVVPIHRDENLSEPEIGQN